MEPVVTPPTPTTPTPVAQTSSKLPWILVVILLLILVGVGGLFFGKQMGSYQLAPYDREMVVENPSKSPTVEVSATPDSTVTLKTQTIKKLDNSSFSSFILSYPDEFTPSEVRSAVSLDFNLQRMDQGIEIRQAPMGGGVCLFKDSPDFQGPSEDLKSVTYTQISTQLGEARYYNTTDNNYKTCWLSQGYYQSMSPVGVVTFSSSLNGYPGGLKSVEDVLKSIKAQ